MHPLVVPHGSPLDSLPLINLLKTQFFGHCDAGRGGENGTWAFGSLEKDLPPFRKNKLHLITTCFPVYVIGPSSHLSLQPLATTDGSKV